MLESLGEDTDTIKQLDLARARLDHAVAVLNPLSDLDSFLNDLVITSADLLGAEGGAVGRLDGAGARLLVRDTYPGHARKGERISQAFSLPVDWSSGSGWHKTLESDRFWWAEISDPRFTEGFKSYHDERGRRFFVHFPILVSGQAQGFLGLSFRSAMRPKPVQTKIAQVMAGQAGLAIKLANLAGGPLIQAAGSDSRSSDSDFARKLTERIEWAIRKQDWAALTTARLAAFSGYSPRHFHKLFGEAFGMTPHAYCLDRRLSVSSELLCQGQSVSSIAFQLGFADQAHFARHYRLKFGITPSQTASADRR